MTSQDIHYQEEANKQYLRASLDVIKARLNMKLAGTEGNQDAVLSSEEQMETTKVELRKNPAEQLPQYPLDLICAAFGLSVFESEVLLLCAGVELDFSIGQLCASLQGDPRKVRPTFSLALAVLEDPHWSALTPSAPLRYWRLVELGPGDTLTSSPLRIDERVMHQMLGVPHLDERMRGIVEPVLSWCELPPSHQGLVNTITGLLSGDASVSGSPVIQLWGIEAEGKRAIARAVCAKLGMMLHVIQSSAITNDPVERDGLVRLWERETILIPTALLVDCDELESREIGPSAIHFMERVQGILMVSSRQPLRLYRRNTLRFEVNKPKTEEQRELWRSYLGFMADDMDGQLKAVITQFNLGLEGIREASAEMLSRRRDDSFSDPGIKEPGMNESPGSLLWEACRRQARPRMDDMAQRIRPVATWDDLVLPSQQLQILREIAAHVKQRSRVYDDWGFSTKSSSGLGISALFAGESGTGKTMAAEVLANGLRLDLYRIDLSQVVSKYIGETEKNLRRVFDAAEDGGAILLFDEADALFGKRSEVKDSHDRYANLEISYLLQRMEAYRGLAILTTNMRSALDRAFLRRIRFIVQFPFPGLEEREMIWKRIFPGQVPIRDLNFQKLAGLNVAGGNIRNIALYAAFLAAEAGEPVGMHHLLRAAKVEYAKLERPLTEVGEWE